ncbi:MAG TPA: hypothetical protein VGK99_21210 [Acidobacteriota bacterium]
MAAVCAVSEPSTMMHKNNTTALGIGTLALERYEFMDARQYLM